MKRSRLINYIVHIYAGGLISGCHSVAPNLPKPDSVVVIFKNAPEQSSTHRLGGMDTSVRPDGTLIYVDTALRAIYYTPRNIGLDTLSIPTYGGYAEIIHRNQAIDEIPYLLKAGDTVLFTYGTDLRPLIKSTTSEANTRLYNLPFHDPRAVQPTGYSTRTVLNHLEYKVADNLINHSKRTYPAELTARYRQFYINLDSLQPLYTQFLADFGKQLDSLETTGALPEIYADYYRQRFIDTLSKNESLPSDSLLHYISFNKQALTYQYRIAPYNASAPQRFRLVAADSALSQTARKVILSNVISLIENGDYWTPYPVDTVQKYRKRYEQLTGDTLFRRTVIDKANIVPKGYSIDLALEGLDGKHYAYDDILAQYRGKVIYVDLWASWCAPCRAGMPDAKKLREEYKGQDVVFLYLAVNDTQAEWKNAVKSCGTDYLGENYFVLNSDTSLFFKEIKMTSIPCLLLYDCNGKLVDMDAPRPDSKEIHDLLNKYIR